MRLLINPDTRIYTNTLGACGTISGTANSVVSIDTSLPLYTDYSPFVNNVPGFGQLYFSDNSGADFEYATDFDWNALTTTGVSEYFSGIADVPAFGVCYANTMSGNENWITTCTDEVIHNSNYYSDSTCATTSFDDDDYDGY